MTVKECYGLIGADYEEVMGRLRSEDRVRRFLLKVPKDKSYGLLCRSIGAGDMKEAFRAAHTLKGVCQNLSLTALYHSASELTDLLRDGADYTDEAAAAFEQVKADYQRMVDGIQAVEQEADGV